MAVTPPLLRILLVNLWSFVNTLHAWGQLEKQNENFVGYTFVGKIPLSCDEDCYRHLSICALIILEDETATFLLKTSIINTFDVSHFKFPSAGLGYKNIFLYILCVNMLHCSYVIINLCSKLSVSPRLVLICC